MGTANYFDLKETNLSNNCPECYSTNGLTLTYKQKIIDNVLYKANGTETVVKMHCKNCNSDIFPVRWTEDIERVVAYQDRALQLKPKSLKIKPLGWFLIILDAFLLITVLLIATGVITF
ncbi:MAG: hypothetical protein HKN40_04570 [Winogradskyella sp.]|uniref:hypothetical protein n=1 Tax=Winogradskyella sp. TaxID=1883156 RepID=UPI0018101C43|nr:hypothetical protein [Winogradskyella sp.]